MKAGNRYQSLLHLILLSTLLLAGCALPAPVDSTPVQPTADLGLQYTAAVNTLIARETEDAAAPPPTATVPEVAATATLESITPTAEIPPADAATATTMPTGVLSTATVTPLPTALPTATLLPSDPRANLGSPSFHEPFDDSTDWGFARDDHSDMAVENGQLTMTAFKPDGWDSWTVTWVAGEDFYIEMTATPGACAGGDRYGLIFTTPQDASEGYLFGISCDGRYSLRAWDGEKNTRIVDWTASDKIKAGANQTNRLGVWKDDDIIRLYVNGFLLKEIDDETFDEGHFGVFIGARETENFTVKVDLIDWWDL